MSLLRLLIIASCSWGLFSSLMYAAESPGRVPDVPSSISPKRKLRRQLPRGAKSELRELSGEVRRLKSTVRTLRNTGSWAVQVPRALRSVTEQAARKDSDGMLLQQPDPFSSRHGAAKENTLKSGSLEDSKSKLKTYRLWLQNESLAGEGPGETVQALHKALSHWAEPLGYSIEDIGKAFETARNYLDSIECSLPARVLEREVTLTSLRVLLARVLVGEEIWGRNNGIMRTAEDETVLSTYAGLLLLGVDSLGGQELFFSLLKTKKIHHDFWGNQISNSQSQAKALSRLSYEMSRHPRRGEDHWLAFRKFVAAFLAATSWPDPSLLLPDTERSNLLQRSNVHHH